MTIFKISLIIYSVVAFIVIIVMLSKCLRGESLINYIRIQRLKRMIRADENNYQKIFVLLKKIKFIGFNEFLIFRVSYLKTFKDNYRQYTFGNEREEPFVSLREMKKCNTVEELKTLIDETKTTVKVIYTHNMAAFFSDIDE